MENEKHIEIVNKLKGMPEFRVYIEFLKLKIEELNTLEDLEFSVVAGNAERIAMEVRGRQIAVALLREELSTFLLQETEVELIGDSREYSAEIKN